MEKEKQHDATVTTLVEQLLTGQDPGTRRRAAEELVCQKNSYTAIAALAAALKDDNKGVRDAATRSLLMIGTEQVARSVVEYITETNIVTRNSASISSSDWATFLCNHSCPVFMMKIVMCENLQLTSLVLLVTRCLFHI